MLLDAAFIHAVGDLLQNVGVLVAAALIYFQPGDVGETNGISNWNYADPFCTVLFSILVLWSTMSPLRRSVFTIMQQSPSHIDVEEYERRLLAVEHVIDVQDLHVWSVGSNKSLSTAHLQIDALESSTDVLNESVRISRDMEIGHTTFQLNVRGLFDLHRGGDPWGGIHGHERCCGSPHAPKSPHAPSDIEHGHGHGHAH
jgi:zinc transporter 2